MLRRRPVAVWDDWRAPGLPAVGGLRDAYLVGVFRRTAPLEPMRGERLAGQGDDGRKVCPIDEKILALRDGAWRRPPAAIERREAKCVRRVRGRFEPGEIDAPTGTCGKVRLTATGRRGRSKGLDRPEPSAAAVARR